MEKFSFDRVFTGDGKATEPRPRARRSFRPEEVDEIKTTAAKEGERSALVRAEQAAAQQIAVLSARVDEVLNTLKLETDKLRDDATRLGAEIARRFVRRFIDKAPELYLERCIDECLEVMHREPELIVTIPAGSAPSLKARLVRLAEERGLAASLRIEESPRLKASDCRLNWKSGGAEVSLEDAMQRIDTIIEDHIASLHASEQQQQPHAQTA